MNEFFAVRVGSRFVFVNLLPTLALTILVGGLMAAGAPANPPSWQAFTAFVDEMTWLGAFLLAFAVVVASVVLHPLAYPMIQALEGYWENFHFGEGLKAKASGRYHRWRKQLNDLNRAGQPTPELEWLPPGVTPTLPTSLGNVMQAGEIRAGQRYGYHTTDIMQRLSPIMSPAIRNEVTDTRNQLDTAARLCAFGLIAVPITLFLLWSHGPWLLVPLGCYLFAWAAYRAAVAAARRFCDAVCVAVDFHHLQLWDALSLQRPNDLGDEQDRMAPLLCQLLRDGQSLPADKRAPLVYLPPPIWPNNQFGNSAGQQQTPPPPSGGGVAG